MNPILLQKQLRDNNTDLMDFCADLKQWGEEMKQKDHSLKEQTYPLSDNVPLVRNKVRKHTVPKSDSNSELNTSEVNKRIKGHDYAAWDKYDVEAECSKIDEEKSEDDNSSDLTDECDEAVREEAIVHKEKGNKFVKKGKWNQAIDCYTKAIECFAYDPIFYANRALCHLKNSDYRLAESDCTTAIQLDKTYVKAYHRRAQAREALNQIKEAHEDLLKVFDYEPDNKESKTALAKLEKKLESVAKDASTKTNNADQRPKSKFTLSRQQKSVTSTTPQSIGQTHIETVSTSQELKAATYWPGGQNVELVKAVTKAPHMRSKKPLRKVIVKNLEEVKSQPLPSLSSDNTVIKCDDFKIVERKIINWKESVSENKCQDDLVPEKNNKEEESFHFNVPDTSVQFNYDWKLLKNNLEWRYLYIKQVPPHKLKDIFNESLECDIFSGIINTLAEMFIVRNVPFYEYLIGLAEVKRFNMLVMFMTDADKSALQKLVKHMGSDKNISPTIVSNILIKYGI